MRTYLFYCLRCHEAFEAPTIRELCPECHAGGNYKKYGLTRDEFRVMVRRSGGCCDCCGEVAERLSIEHNHATGLVRGLTCVRCNTVLLAALESPYLRRARSYLRRTDGLKKVEAA